jgi:hypothetical protein
VQNSGRYRCRDLRVKAEEPKPDNMRSWSITPRGLNRAVALPRKIVGPRRVDLVACALRELDLRDDKLRLALRGAILLLRAAAGKARER